MLVGGSGDNLLDCGGGDTNILRNIELVRIGGDIYQAKADMPELAIGETKPVADFVQVVGVAELQVLEVPASWLVL